MMGTIFHSAITPLLILLVSQAVEPYQFLSEECPEVLRYQQISNKLEGTIELHRPLRTTKYKLEIKYCVPTKIANGAGGYSITINADDPRQLTYKYIFPFISPVPAIQYIEFNGRKVCQGPQGESRGTCISVSHQRYDAPERECGKPTRPHGTAPGNEVERGEWPWVVGIFHQRDVSTLEFKCGGSLIDNLHILTSAHCLQDDQHQKIERNQLFVKVGVQDLVKYFEENTEIVGIGKVAIHPKYQAGSLIDDIAIITLSRNVTFTPYIQPVCLWDNENDEQEILNKSATVVSWGQKNQAEDMYAAYAQKRIVLTSNCAKPEAAYQHAEYSKTFCAGSRDQPGACKGDSGGGLYMQQGENWSLRGIVSSPNDGICSMGDEIGYTDVAKYNLWIRDNI